MIQSRRDSYRPADAIAGLMSAGALFLGAFELFYRPFRLAPVALILILAATIMSKRQQRLTTVALTVVGICFVVGATLQVLTNHPLF